MDGLEKRARKQTFQVNNVPIRQATEAGSYLKMIMIQLLHSKPKINKFLEEGKLRDKNAQLKLLINQNHTAYESNSYKNQYISASKRRSPATHSPTQLKQITHQNQQLKLLPIKIS